MEENMSLDEMTKFEKTQAIGLEEINKATMILKKYQEGKANLEYKIKNNEEWWKLRHWERMHAKKEKINEPTSAWLFNVIMSKHADCMDGYPTPNVLPREEDDKAEAKKLSSIIPVVLAQNNFEQVYSDEAWYKLRQGTGVYQVTWEQSKLNGMGDIDIRSVDLLRLFWEPGINDIQDSKNVFYCELIDNEILETAYPDLAGNLKGSNVTLSQYYYDDTVDTSDKSLVINWYYKKNVDGRVVLHYVKYVNDQIIYATENDTEVETQMQQLPTGEMMETPVGESMAQKGLYDHGQYPFVFDVLFPLEGTPCGFGYVDVCKSAQEQIDLMNSAIEKNTLMASRPRYFVREDGAVNEEEFADWTKDLIHTDGNLGDDSIKPIVVNPLSSLTLDILNNKVNELKETSGNRDVNNGGTSSGVTAYSAIVAMQEQSGKGSRDATAEAYRAFSKVCYLVIELIRQFYDMPRQFRITGDQGQEMFTSFDNAGIQPQPLGMIGELDLGMRLPVFDIDVQPQKANRYTQVAQNELAIQMFQLGVFNPQMCDQALALLDFMDFDHKEGVIQKVQQNGGLFQQNQQLSGLCMQLSQMVDALQGTNYTAQTQQLLAQMSGQQVQMGLPPQDVSNQITTADDVGKNKLTQTLGDKAKAQAQSATTVQ